MYRPIGHDIFALKYLKQACSLKVVDRFATMGGSHKKYLYNYFPSLMNIYTFHSQYPMGCIQWRKRRQQSVFLISVTKITTTNWECAMQLFSILFHDTFYLSGFIYKHILIVIIIFF